MSGNILISGFRLQREEFDSVYEVAVDLALSVSGEVLPLLKNRTAFHKYSIFNHQSRGELAVWPMSIISIQIVAKDADCVSISALKMFWKFPKRST